MVRAFSVYNHYQCIALVSYADNMKRLVESRTSTLPCKGWWKMWGGKCCALHVCESYFVRFWSTTGNCQQCSCHNKNYISISSKQPKPKSNEMCGWLLWNGRRKDRHKNVFDLRVTCKLCRIGVYDWARRWLKWTNYWMNLGSQSTFTVICNANKKELRSQLYM